MKVTCVQMNMEFCRPEDNYLRAEELIREAMAENPDVIVLPETWNTGFFPKAMLEQYCDRNGQQVKTRIGALAKELNVNIVAGSVSNLRDGKIYNTSMIFDRTGACIATYDKTHLFTNMNEHKHYTSGDHICRFTLDGVSCGIIICYDIRFPELIRTMTVPGLDVLFVVSQWPAARTFHLRSLTIARAIENQMFVVCCNSCGNAGKVIYGGNSSIVDPWGETLALGGETEELVSAKLDLTILDNIRSTIPVFDDRRPELYKF